MPVVAHARVERRNKQNSCGELIGKGFQDERRAPPIVGFPASASLRAVARSIGCSSNGSGIENGAGTAERSSRRM